MTEVNSEQKYDQSIYQDFVLKDDTLVTINNGGEDEVSGDYKGHVEIREGDKSLFTQEMNINPDGTAYELRIGSDQTAQLFKPGKKYTMLVYEENELLKYKMYIHKETIKILS